MDDERINTAAVFTTLLERAVPQVFVRTTYSPKHEPLLRCYFIIKYGLFCYITHSQMIPANKLFPFIACSSNIDRHLEHI